MNPVAELEDCLRAALSDEREFHGAAVALNIVNSMLRRGVSATKLQAHEWGDDLSHCEESPATDYFADEVLYDLLSACAHSDFELETTDPRTHERLIQAQPKCWRHRLNYARAVVELQNETKLTMVRLADEYKLDERRLRELIPLGRVLVVDPELACRLVNSDIPWSMIKKYFSQDRYMRMYERLHEVWGAKRARSE